MYARGQMDRKTGHLSNLGHKGDYWTEWLEEHRMLPLRMIHSLEIWIGGTLRGGFSDGYQLSSWIKIGSKGPLLFICSRPGNVVVTISIDYTVAELDDMVEIDMLLDTKDEALIEFIREDLAMQDKRKTCKLVSLSLPTSRNRWLDPDTYREAEEVPGQVYIR